MQASPSQLEERTRRRKGWRSEGLVPSGRWIPRLKCCRRKSGTKFFHRLCTQNQSAGERLISDSRSLFRSMVISAIVRPSVGTGALVQISQRANPTVRTLTMARSDPVFWARLAARGEVEAIFPKSGIQIPAPPACWSVRIPTTPPFLSRSLAPCIPFFLSKVATPRLRRSRLTRSSMSGLRIAW